MFSTAVKLLKSTLSSLILIFTDATASYQCTKGRWLKTKLNQPIWCFLIAEPKRNSPEDLGRLHPPKVHFICSCCKRHLTPPLQQTRWTLILTVAESDCFLNSGHPLHYRHSTVKKIAQIIFLSQMIMNFEGQIHQNILAFEPLPLFGNTNTIIRNKK